MMIPGMTVERITDGLLAVQLGEQSEATKISSAYGPALTARDTIALRASRKEASGECPDGR